MQTTPNIALKKWEASDTVKDYNEEQNNNWDKIDNEIGQIKANTSLQVFQHAAEVPSVYGVNSTVASVSLPPGRTYLAIVTGKESISDDNSIMNLAGNISNSGASIIGYRQVRCTMSAGGGASVSFLVSTVNATTQTILSVTMYGYVNRAYNHTASVIAVPIG